MSKFSKLTCQSVKACGRYSYFMPKVALLEAHGDSQGREWRAKILIQFNGFDDQGAYEVQIFTLPKSEAFTCKFICSRYCHGFFGWLLLLTFGEG